MDTKSTVLAYLNQHANQWVTSAELVDELGVSRTAIWKAIQQLQAHGQTIESQSGKGYLYLRGLKLSQAIIESSIKSDWQVEVYDEIDSTNIRAKQLAATNPGQRTVVIANQQTAGYGRFGRNFFSPGETGLYLSFLLPINGQINPGKMTTATAVVIAQVLEKLFGVTVEIKWVNDLIVNHHKVTGILSEAVTNFETGTLSSVIVGIGINLVENDLLAPELKNKVGALTTQKNQLDRNQVASEIIDAFDTMLPTLDDGNFMDEYRQRSLVIGKNVEVKIGNRVLTGEVETINDDGALLLKTATEVVTVNAGEITKLNLQEGDYRG
ncbi:biotin--[acetyl-CoA-carboxylase] ligase [Paucilactobacillus nenjiangensis]|uniref:biotin--[acetyl-CoA-carboxylase] ligase n=1 Tax=Paucilactobacillus nenjiangensis TaxID=1296540 RepID=UPI003FA20453